MHKRMITIVLCLTLLAICLPISAHTSSQSGVLAKEKIPQYNNQYYIGGTVVGWSIDESCHAYTNSVTYKFDSIVDTDWRDFIKSADSRWSSTVAIDVSSTGTGLVELDAFDIHIAAEFYDPHPNSNGHITVSGTSWKIRVNTNYIRTVTKAIIAHEFGHVIGLNDMYSYSNRDKLMYGIDDPDNTLAANYPTTQDKRGAEVITGQHTSHTWEYVFYRTNSSGVEQHRRRCTYCKGIKYNSIENCTFNAYGVCIRLFR